MTAGPRVLVLAILLFPVGYAHAQMLPWPGQSGATQSAPPASVPVTPGPSAAPPAAQCIAEFTNLREAVVEKGMAAKAAAQRKATRSEMCEYITAYAAAEARWIDFTEARVQTCDIPATVVDQMRKVPPTPSGPG